VSITAQTPGAGTPDERELAYRALVRATRGLGLPQELAYVMSGELKSAKAMRQMTTYLMSARPGSVEEVVDEMLAIVQNRNTWIEHQMREQSNARITAWYNRQDRPSEDFDDPEDIL